MRAVYTPDNRKAIQGTTPTGRTEVYDLAADPLEQQDVAAAHEDYARWAQGWLNTWASAARSRRIDDAMIQTLGDDLIDKLKVLGYVDPSPGTLAYPGTTLHE